MNVKYYNFFILHYVKSENWKISRFLYCALREIWNCLDNKFHFKISKICKMQNLEIDKY